MNIEFYSLEYINNNNNNIEVEEFENLKSAKNALLRILNDKINYNYSINKNDIYIIYKVIYNHNIKDYEYDEILKISIQDYKNMNFFEREKIF